MNDPIYLIVGFGLTWGALLWYAVRVARRIREAARVLKMSGSEPGASGR
ncbi:MAG: hypothetical protein ACRELC_14895 [Gemmatimonadota bacterium]